MDNPANGVLLELKTLQAEFWAANAAFITGNEQFLHYVNAGRMAEAKAVHAQNRVLLDRQHELQARIEELVNGD